MTRLGPAFFCIVAAGCGQPEPPAVQRFGGETMGSTYEVKFVGPQAVAEVQAVVAEELAATDLAFSQWRPDAEIQRVNAHASTAPLPLSPRFAAVLTQALAIAAVTEGAFDPTVEPLVALYRKAKKDPAHRLDEARLAAAKAMVDYRAVQVRDGALVKARPELRLDLDGIVAGACIDSIATRLDRLGVPAYYLEVTGEIYCRGEKAPGVPWRIGIVDPVADAAGESETVRELPLRDRALCTSGDYRNAFLADGTLVHHVFDPRTGHSAAHGVVSASVLASSAAVADALGTALMVLGESEARRLWPTWQREGEPGVLLLQGESGGRLREVEIGWPADAGGSNR